ncbi:MAG: YbhB/YbcL family Raf kinase inhibitor-like protein [Terriglobia bacterium]
MPEIEYRRRTPRVRADGNAVLIAAILLALLLSAPAPGGFAAGRAAGQRLSLISSAFNAQGMIPSRYTCSGANVSPALMWANPPAGTRSFALIVTDPDAPGGTFTHWVAFNLPPGQHRLSEGLPQRAQIAAGGAQGSNDFPGIGYEGPCPPPGNPHHYFFRLYALDCRLPLKPGATRGQVERAMKGHVLGEAVLTGLFGR